MRDPGDDDWEVAGRGCTSSASPTRKVLRSWTFWDIVWFILISFAFVAYLMVMFAIIADLFRDPDASGIVEGRLDHRPDLRSRS